MTEAQIKEAERQKALEMITATEKYLGNLYGHLNMFCTGEEQDYRDPHDNVERCMQMVLGQVMEAWTHAGRARKRLIALHQAEPSSSASSQPPVMSREEFFANWQQTLDRMKAEPSSSPASEEQAE